MTLLDSIKDLRKFFLILTFLLVFFIMLSPPQDADMWWHLAAGREMVSQEKIITIDKFSYTHQGEKWTNAFWISDIVLFLAYELGGYLGIILLVALTAVLSMAITYLHIRPKPFPLPLLIIVLAAFAIAPVWTPRPQIFSFLLLAVLAYGLRGHDGFILRRPWLLVILFILWANMHGGFIWGLLLMIAFLVGNLFDNLFHREDTLPFRQLGNIGIWTLAATLAISINPNGISLWKLPFYTVGVSIQSITEWGSPDFHRLDLHPILWLLFLFLVGAGYSEKKLSWRDIFTVIGFSYMAFVSQRSIGPFVIVATPIIINSLDHVWTELMQFLSGLIKRFRNTPPSNPVPPVIRVMLNVVILGTIAALAAMRAHSVSTPEQVYVGLPLNAVEWIQVNQPRGRMFNSYNWGGYMQWELPQYPVFIDGRADLYGEKTINEWWSVVNARDEGLRELDSWQVNFVILEPGWPILERLSQNGWRVLYKDEVAIIMAR